MSGQIRHGGHPVLTSAVSNTVTQSDNAGNLRPNKARGNTLGPIRIDGAVALLMALALARRTAQEPPKLSLNDFLADMRRVAA